MKFMLDRDYRRLSLLAKLDIEKKKSSLYVSYPLTANALSLQQAQHWVKHYLPHDWFIHLNYHPDPEQAKASTNHILLGVSADAIWTEWNSFVYGFLLETRETLAFQSLTSEQQKQFVHNIHLNTEQIKKTLEKHFCTLL